MDRNDQPSIFYEMDPDGRMIINVLWNGRLYVQYIKFHQIKVFVYPTFQVLHYGNHVPDHINSIKNYRL